MRFDAPAWWWLVAPLLVYLAWTSRRSYAQLGPWARRASLAARSLMLLLLVAALARPVLPVAAGRRHVVFVLDVSRSVTAENRKAALEEVDRLAREASSSPDPARVSVVAFGEDARLLVREADRWSGWAPELRERVLFEETLAALRAERARGSASDGGGPATALGAGERPADRAREERIRVLEGFRDQVAGEHTNLERALRLALNCGGTGDRRTLYVLTDGHFDRGRWAEAWGEAAASLPAGAALRAVRLDRPAPPEVVVTGLALPARVRVHQGFSVDARATANVETAARLSVFKDGFAVAEREVRVARGTNVFRVEGLAFDEKGFHVVEAVLRPAADTRLENNRVRALVVVPGEARVLYVDRDEDKMMYLKNALEIQGIQVEARPASGVPRELPELLGYDAFILSNIPADRLTPRQMQMIRSYVRDFGGGFVMLGGEESFGLGGYYNTPVEETLPVRMPIQKELTRPSTAILLVIDKSGSMEGVKIQLAKRAAVATAEVIHPRDLIGVIGFDAASRVLLELTPAADRATVTSRIAGLEAGGGTFLYPALEDAHDRLLSSNARRKHVIVLSDGQTQGQGYEEKVQSMASDGITLSAVGIGEDADMQLLEAIARAGNGRAYFTNDFNNIPQIFTREALRASNSMLVEGLTRPVALREDPALKGIDRDELPLLSGYVATTPKPAGQLVLVSEAGDPIFARWRFGLGWAVAFTSETKPRWAEDWLEWGDFAKFWGQLVRSVTGEDLAKDVAIACGHEASETGVTLTADVRDASDNFLSGVEMEAAVVEREGKPRPLAVRQRGPGLYEARWPELPYGRDLQFVWTLRRGGGVERAAPYGLAAEVSPEYGTLGPAEEVFAKMAARGAEVSSVGSARLRLGGTGAPEREPYWPRLLVAALLLAPLDILFRRMG